MGKRHSVEIVADGTTVGDLIIRLGDRCQGVGILGITELDATPKAGASGHYVLSWNAPAISPNGGRGLVTRALSNEGIAIVTPAAKAERE